MAMSVLGEANRVVYLSERSADFVELMRIRLLSKSPGDHLAIARSRGSSGRILDMISKGAIAPGSTTDPNYTALLAQLAEGFLGSLGLFSAFDQILSSNGFLKVPLQTRVLVVTLSGSGANVAEADAKPIARLSLASNEIPYFKSVSIVVLTNELVRSVSPGSSDLIANELRRGVGAATDQVFTDLLVNSTSVATVPSTGLFPVDFFTDLQNALSEISCGATSKLFLIVPPALNRRLITMRDAAGAVVVNGVVGSSIRVVASDSLSDTAVLLDGSQIAAASGDITIDQSRNSALQLSDDPTTGSQLVSLFQNNLVAARAERFFGVEILTPRRSRTDNRREHDGVSNGGRPRTNFRRNV